MCVHLWNEEPHPNLGWLSEVHRKPKKQRCCCKVCGFVRHECDREACDSSQRSVDAVKLRVVRALTDCLSKNCVFHPPIVAQERKLDNGNI